MTDTLAGRDGEAMTADTIDLRLLWDEVSGQSGRYTASAPTFPSQVGCIYLGVDGRWQWAMTADDYQISRNCGPTSGEARSARHAAAAVEHAWFLAIVGTTHDMPAPAVNAYAAAKQRSAA